jgi:hypothetical protein
MSRNRDLLDDFTDYCRENPEERFWQALRNWSGQAVIWASKTGSDHDRSYPKDTLYWEGRNGQRRSVDADAH